jgi:hypothetical protein
VDATAAVTRFAKTRSQSTFFAFVTKAGPELVFYQFKQFRPESLGQKKLRSKFHMHLLEIMVIYDVGYADNLVVDNIETK